MTFLNIALIFGVLGLNIPIIIHLLNRNRFKVVHWGAMHLLNSVVRVNRRRIRLEQLILLLIRAMIPVCLALAMAMPVITGCQELAGNSRSSLIVLLDNSYSMSAGGANASFHQARDAAAAMLRDLRDGSDADVVLMAGSPGPLTQEPTTRLGLLIDQTQTLNSAYGSADVPTAMQVGADLISRMQHAKRDVVVITDMQRISWSPDQADARRRVSEWLRERELSPSLTLMHVGRDATDNVAVTDLSLSKSVVGVGQKLLIRANLKNYGEKTYTSLRVHLSIDGNRKSFQEVTLGPGEDGQALFTHEFDKPGSHLIRIEAEADATLKEDNEYLQAVQVLDRIPVLLVDGDPAPPGEPLRGETAFLETALQPFPVAGGQQSLANLMQAKVVAAGEFKAESIGGEKVMVLANVEQLRDDQLRAVEGFVQGGGGLLIFPGNRINADWYNTKLHAAGAGLMPLKLTSLAGSVTDQSKRTSIATEAYTHPALAIFNDRRNGNLSAGDVWTWYRLEGQAPGAAGAGAGQTATLVMARLESGDPFLAEKRMGEGTVILCATACDGDWSGLPVRPFYVPLMQQLAAYAASSTEPPRNVLTGQPLLANLPASAVEAKATMTDPAGVKHSVTIQDRGSRAVVEYKATQAFGLYTLDVLGEPIHFVVSTPRKESDLRQLSGDEIQAVATEMKADVVTTLEEYRRLDKTRRHGVEVWDWFFWMVIALFFLELILEYRFASSGRV